MLPLGVAKSSHGLLPQKLRSRPGTLFEAVTTVAGLELGVERVPVEIAPEPVPVPVPMQPAAASRTPAAAIVLRWRRVRLPMAIRGRERYRPPALRCPREGDGPDGAERPGAPRRRRPRRR